MLTETNNDQIDQTVVSDIEPKKTRSNKAVKESQSEDRKMVRTAIHELDIPILDCLRGSLSRADYLHNLLIEEKARQSNGHQSSEKDSPELGTDPQVWFTTTSKNVDPSEIGKALGVEGEEIKMSERDLLAKASELSGESVEDIQIHGRQTRAQKLITQFCKPGEGRGSAGSADTRLDQALEAVQEMIAVGTYKGRLSLTAVANRGMANFNTAKSWAIRRGHQTLFDMK